MFEDQINELIHEKLAKKMYDLGGPWNDERYSILANAMGTSNISLSEVMAMCEYKIKFRKVEVEGRISWIPTGN